MLTAEEINGLYDSMETLHARMKTARQAAQTAKASLDAKIKELAGIIKPDQIDQALEKLAKPQKEAFERAQQDFAAMQDEWMTLSMKADRYRMLLDAELAKTRSQQIVLVKGD